MKLLIYSLLAVLLLSCNSSNSTFNANEKSDANMCLDNSNISNVKTDLAEDEFSSIVCLKIQDTSGIITKYNKNKTSIIEYRNNLNNNSNKTDSTYNLTSKYLYTQLLENIIPFWYGTPWDFNGYTDVPNNGTIACGYFVSTTLKHLGFNLNRYKVAQQYSLKIIEILCGKENAKTWSPEQFDKMISYIKSREEDVYLVGLSCHVGFLSLENDTVYFLHSSYIEPLCVIKEYAESSPILKQSSIFVTGPLFSNRELVNKWINNEGISVE